MMFTEEFGNFIKHMDNCADCKKKMKKAESLLKDITKHYDPNNQSPQDKTLVGAMVKGMNEVSKQNDRSVK